LRPLRRARRFVSVRGGDARGELHRCGLFRSLTLSSASRNEVPARNTHSSRMRTPGKWSVRRGRAPVIPRPHRAPARWWSCDRWPDVHLCKSMLNPSTKRVPARCESAEAERACSTPRLRPDWLPYDRARELKHRTTVAGLMTLTVCSYGPKLRTDRKKRRSVSFLLTPPAGCRSFVPSSRYTPLNLPVS